MEKLKARVDKDCSLHPPGASQFWGAQEKVPGVKTSDRRTWKGDLLGPKRESQHRGCFSSCLCVRLRSNHGKLLACQTQPFDFLVFRSWPVPWLSYCSLPMLLCFSILWLSYCGFLPFRPIPFCLFFRDFGAFFLQCLAFFGFFMVLPFFGQILCGCFPGFLAPNPAFRTFGFSILAISNREPSQKHSEELPAWARHD